MFSIMLVLSLFWLTLFLGMFDKFRFKSYNFKNLKSSEKYDVKISQLTFEEWREREKQKDNLGLWVSLLISAVGFGITLIVIM